MTELWIVIGALLIVAISFFGTNALQNDCKAKGGVLIRSAVGYECVKAEVLK